MTPCREWQGELSHNGYGRRYELDIDAPLNRNGNHRRTGKRIAVHRWVWEQVNGPVPEGHDVAHKCDNPPCFRYDHLFLATKAENIQDKVNKNRQAKGENSGRSVLTESQVLEIYASTEPGVDLADRYSVSPATISAIRKGRNWSWLTLTGAESSVNTRRSAGEGEHSS